MLRRLEKPFALSNKSKNILNTCDSRLQVLVQEVLFYMDVTVVEGTRDRTKQENAKKSGNSKANFGESPHNYKPSLAVDLVPYPIPRKADNDWDENSPKWDELFHIMDMLSKQKGIDITWGGHFKKFVDKPHFEIKDWKKYVSGLDIV